jgi:type I restriction enzyme R subunit
VDPDVQEARAQERFSVDEPVPTQIAEVSAEARASATAPFLPAIVRDCILNVQTDTEQVIDTVSQDKVLFAGVSEADKAKARETVASFAEYLREHRDEITAIELLYSKRHGQGPDLKQLKQLAEAIQAPPRGWTAAGLWHAYQLAEAEKVRGGGKRTAADLVALVRFALEKEPVLVPFAETVHARFNEWMAEQVAAGAAFTPAQTEWLEMIRDHVAQSLTVTPEHFDYVPFSERGGLGRAAQVFGDRLNPLLEELSEVLAA